MSDKSFKLENGSIVNISKWSVPKQAKNLCKILKTLGSSVMMLIPDENNKVSMNETLPQAIAYLCEILEEEGVEQFFDMLLDGAWVGDHQTSLSQLEDFDDALIIISEVLVLNYSKLLEGKGFSAFAKVATPLVARVQG